MSVVLEELVARLRLDSSGLREGLTAAQGHLATAGSSMSAVGGKLTRSVTLPLVGIATAGVVMAGKFDATMRQVAIATGTPMGPLKKLAMQMGAETAYSAGEASDAMLELAKGGMSAVQIQGGGIQATMKLAAAGQVSLAEAATTTSNAMSMFGLRARDSNQIVVALAGAANASSASVSSLAQGLAQGGLAAKSAGLSLQETTGILAEFDAAGLKGSDAGTSLKAMLNGLIPNSERAADALEQLGVNAVRSDGSFRPLSVIAEQMHSKLGKLTEAQRAYALTTAFGTDGMRAATILMNGGGKAMDRYTKASLDSATTNKLAGSAMEGISGAIEKAKGSMETASLVLGDTLAPVVIAVAGFVEKAANAFGAMNPKVRLVVVVLGGIAAAIGPLLLLLGGMATGLSVVTGALAAVSAPVILVVAGIAALVAGLVYAYTHFASFRAGVQSALSGVAAFIQGPFMAGVRSIGASFQVAAAAVLPVVLQLVGIVRANLPGILAVGRQVFSTLGTIITTAMRVVSVAIRVALGVIGALWSVFGGVILGTVRRVFPAVVQVIRGVLNIIQGIFRVIGAALRGDWSGVWRGLGQIVRGAGQVIAGLVRGLFALLRGIFLAAVAALAAVARAIWKGITAAFSAGVRGAVAVVRHIGSDIRDVFSGAGSWLASAGKNVVEGFVGGIRSMAKVVTNALIGLLPGPLKKFASKLGLASPSKVFRQFGVHTGQGFVDGLDAMRGAVATAASRMAEAALVPPPSLTPAGTFGGTPASRSATTAGQGGVSVTIGDIRAPQAASPGLIGDVVAGRIVATLAGRGAAATLDPHEGAA